MDKDDIKLKKKENDNFRKYFIKDQVKKGVINEKK